MLSILIPTYNYDVLPLVQELHKQAMDENIAFEIIVLDDASPDKALTAENQKINLLDFAEYLENEANSGRTLTRKILAERAQYDNLLFLDADVMPTSGHFIRDYLPFIGKEPVVIGGIAYKELYEKDTELRHKYGKMREERTSAERAVNPYGAVLSGNLLIDKQVFLSNNYSHSHNLYGMDIYFAYQLYRNGIKVVHIDNPVYHLGLEDNATFFRKTLAAVESRKKLLKETEGIENINGLLKQYKRLRKYRLAGVVKVLFRLGEPVLKKRILKKDPDLFCLDIYRLGYICSLQ